MKDEVGPKVKIFIFGSATKTPCDETSNNSKKKKKFKRIQNVRVVDTIPDWFRKRYGPRMTYNTFLVKNTIQSFSNPINSKSLHKVSIWFFKQQKLKIKTSRCLLYTTKDSE